MTGETDGDSSLAEELIDQTDASGDQPEHRTARSGCCNHRKDPGFVDRTNAHYGATRDVAPPATATY